MNRHLMGQRDGNSVFANYRVDIDTKTDVRLKIDLSGAAKSPPPNHSLSNPQTGYQRVVWVENNTVKEEVIAHLDTEKIDYVVNDLTPTLSEAQNAKIDEIKTAANSILEHTDWYVVRKQETGESIPQSVLDHRSEVRIKSDNIESEINNLETVEKVLNYDYRFPEPPEP